MGTIEIPIPDPTIVKWSEHMAKLLGEIVEDWVLRAQVGNITVMMKDGTTPITDDHVRVANLFFNHGPSQPVVKDVPIEVLNESQNRLGEYID